jgi:hypothetical protein
MAQHDHITIAADAKSLIFGPRGSFTVPVCKIYQSGNSFFAFTGMDQDDASGFVASVLAKKTGVTNLRGRAKRFAQDVKAPFLEVIQKLYREMPRDKYREFFGASMPPLEAIFVGVEQGISVFQVVDVLLKVDKQGEPIGIGTTIIGCPGTLCPLAGNFRFLALGGAVAAGTEFNRMRATND